ncbi:copper-binding protein [Vogesella indigofera]|uniref:copper-binding protein n=1 Tax=Vogesella indigofera TaxID=45465 RepID=UPI00234EB4C9|nr:copper-binding protein [Vogesella indigofera]MDC7697617.1 copper-binding protein [Vogesella indigofera]
MTKLRSILFVTAFGLTAMLPAQATDMGMASAAKPSAQMAHAEGVIKALDAKAGTVTLAHGPVQELKWPAMTMAFKLARPELAKGLAVGKKVTFEFQSQGMAAVITAIKVSG